MARLRRLMICLSAMLFIATGIPGDAQMAFGAACRDHNGNDNGHLITIVNSSNEKVAIGVFGSVFNNDDGRAVPDAGYSHPSNWWVEAGSSLTWCIPAHFNGRFFARTGCDSTGKCLTGDCCKEKTNCTGNICTKTADPASLAEMFVDSKHGTYYDISFVDGYDFPLMLKPVIPVRQTLDAKTPQDVDAGTGSYDFSYDATATIRLKISNYSDDNITVLNATAADFDSAKAITSDMIKGDVTIKYTTGPQDKPVISTIVLAGIAKGKSVSTVSEFNSLGVGVLRFGAQLPVGQTQCSETGCKNPPKCQWGWLADGVCLSPYKMFEIQYPDFRYRPEYYPLAAMCAKNQFLKEGEAACCGCGKTKDCKLGACPTQITVTSPYTGKEVLLNSSGCSPLNKNYDNSGEGNGTEKNQITCNPTSDSTITSYGTKCNPWAAFFKQYTTKIINTCGPDGPGGEIQKSVYTWQYDDDHGLLQCNNDNAMGFNLTILPRDKTTTMKNMVTFTPGYANDAVTPVTGTITVNGAADKLKFVGPDRVILPLATNDKVELVMNCSKPGFTTKCNLVYNGPASGFAVNPEAKSSPVCSDTTIFKDWKNPLIPVAYPDDNWCDSTDTFKLQVSPAEKVSGHVCVGNTATPFKPAPNPPIQVYLKDKDVFRLVQKCSDTRIVDCIADFDIKTGFTPKKRNGDSKVCTDGRINWVAAFTNKNIGLGAWNVDIDCVDGSYSETCQAVYSETDAKVGLQLHKKQAVTHSDPLKLDHNNDGKIDQLDVIRMLRSSQGH